MCTDKNERAEKIMAKKPTLFRPLSLLVPALIALFVAGCSGSKLSSDPSIVALYAGQTLTLDEYERRYARSVGGREAAEEDSLPAYQDFLERYVNFRLKVLAADAAGYDTDPSIQQEINGYRASFARPYLIDKEVMTPILTDLYQKSQEMVEASHILLRVEENAPPADTLAAYEKLVALRDSVLQGMDFGDLAEKYSEDPSARNPRAPQGYRGWLGYFTGGRMVKAFEDMAYQTPPGEVSPVFRSPYGYHLLYVHQRRPVVPAIRISHLMISIPGTTQPDSAEARQRIQDLKTRLEAGEDFAALAREHSEDRNSGRNGGDLGLLRYDNYQVDPTFRAAAFAMDEVGKISDIITTPYGYHLFKITERRSLGTFEEEYESLKQTASRLPRLRKAEVALAKDARSRYAATIDTTALLARFASIGLDTLMNHLRTATFADADRAVPVATLGDSTYTFGQLVTFAHNPEHLIRNMLTVEAQVVEVADVFLDQAAISHEALVLENRDAEFRVIMEEFRDGLVLFKLMEDSVWTAAAQDSAGVEAYFNAHRDAYQFPERTRILSVYSYSDSLLQATVDRLNHGLSWNDLYAETTQAATREIVLDTMRVDGITNSVYDQALAIPEGHHTEPIPYRTGHIVLYRDGVEAARPKTLEEARAEVVNDYQTVLEDRLLTRLRRLYQARTFPERLIRAFPPSPADDPASPSSTQ